LSEASFDFYLDFRRHLADFSQALIFGYFSSRKSNGTLDNSVIYKNQKQLIFSIKTLE
jgi:hypothetical protein